MSDHDPLCPTVGIDEQTQYDLRVYCECDLIARVRADERETIAQQVEAVPNWCPIAHRDPRESWDCEDCVAWLQRDVYARIARGGPVVTLCRDRDGCSRGHRCP